MRGALIWLLLATAPAHAGDSFADEIRAGERLGALGLALEDPHVLMAALDLLLAGGATAEPGDPWGADQVHDALVALAAADPALRMALDRVTATARGVTGPNRLAFRLEPGEVERVRIGLVAGETAIVEARLRRDSGLADIDLVVTGPAGLAIAADRGPDTGRVGRGLYAEWLPAACHAAEVRIINVGDVSAEGVFLAPPAEGRPCD